MKRYIRNSAGTPFEYTNFIDRENVSDSIKTFMETEPKDLDYALVKDAVASLFEELNKFPSPNSMDSLNIIYDEDKRRFFNKYYNFAIKCRGYARMKEFNPSGYGRDDYYKLQIRDLLRKVDFNFPYGWRYA